MAAEQSTRASASGSNSHVPEALNASGSTRLADLLSEVLGQFRDAISVLGVTALALDRATDDAGLNSEIGIFAAVHRHALDRIRSAYERFDLALATLIPCRRNLRKKERRANPTKKRVSRARGRIRRPKRKR